MTNEGFESGQEDGPRVSTHAEVRFGSRLSPKAAPGVCIQLNRRRVWIEDVVDLCKREAKQRRIISRVKFQVCHRNGINDLPRRSSD